MEVNGYYIKILFQEHKSSVCGSDFWDNIILQFMFVLVASKILPFALGQLFIAGNRILGMIPCYLSFLCIEYVTYYPKKEK